MTKRFPTWTLGLAGIILLIIVPVIYFLPNIQSKTDPASHLPEKVVHVDHTDIVKGNSRPGKMSPAPASNVMKMRLLI